MRNWLLVLLTALPAPSFAGTWLHEPKSIQISISHVPNFTNSSECAGAFISTLIVTGISTFPTISDIDLCSLDAKRIPAPLHQVIAQIKSLNLKTAAALSKTPQAVFENGLNVKIAGDSAGPLDSDESKDTVMPDWDGKSVEAPIYVHELGHVLADTKLIEVQSVNTDDTFVESFADLLAASTLKVHEMITDATLPACLQVTRSFSPEKTFNGKLKDFNELTQVDAYLRCCDQVDLKTANEVTRGTCNLLETNKTKFYEVYNVVAPVLERPFDPANVNYAILDRHTYSEPINSFLLELSEKVGTPALTLLLKATQKYGQTSHEKIWTCQAGADPKNTAQIPGDNPSYLDALKLIRNDLKSNQQVDFDRLWALHGMDVGNVIDELSATHREIRNSIPVFYQYLVKNQCDKAEFSHTDACSLSCI